MTDKTGEVLITMNSNGITYQRNCGGCHQYTLNQSYQLVEIYIEQLLNNEITDYVSFLDKLNELQCFHFPSISPDRETLIKHCLYYRLFSYNHFVFKETIIRLLNLIKEYKDNITNLSEMAESFEDVLL